MSFGDLLNATLVVNQLAPVMSGGAEKVGGANTTLSADVAAGASSVVVTAATNIAAGDFLRIGDSGETEVAQVVAGYTTGLTIPLVAPLRSAHDSGDQVRELVDAGTQVLDDYRQPTFAPAIVATVAGRIEPKTEREIALVTQGGALVSTHVGYIWPLSGLTTAMWITAGGVRYDITGVPDAAGHHHHLELDLRAVS